MQLFWRQVFNDSLCVVQRLCTHKQHAWCRYAGRAFDSEKDVGGPGTLMVKGLKSMWRQAPPIVRNTLQGVLTRIIMQVSSQSCFAC